MALINVVDESPDGAGGSPVCVGHRQHPSHSPMSDEAKHTSTGCSPEQHTGETSPQHDSSWHALEQSEPHNSSSQHLPQIEAAVEHDSADCRQHTTPCGKIAFKSRHAMARRRYTIDVLIILHRRFGVQRV